MKRKRKQRWTAISLISTKTTNHLLPHIIEIKKRPRQII